jgi:hypothetical protein
MIASLASKAASKATTSRHLLPSTLRCLSSAPQAAEQVVPTFVEVTQVKRLNNDYYERAKNVEESRSMAGYTSSVRTDWTKEEIGAIYNLPFHDLM